jgi:phosphatidyl-myo-inositol dimannoside synthase
MSRRMLLVTFDPPTGPGGIEGRTMSYTRKLRSYGFHVEVAAISPGVVHSEEPYMGTRLERFSSSPIQSPQTLSGLVKMMHRGMLDSVFILTGGTTIIGLLLLAYSRVSGRRSAVFFYGKDILQSRRKVSARLSVVLSVIFAGRVATNSRYTAGLLPLKPHRPVAIIYPGVDPTVRDRTDGSGRGDGLPRILFVGRLVRRKGADLLLEAFAPLLSSFPGLTMDIVGDGPEMGRLRARASELGLDGPVTFHGTLDGQRLWQVYARATLLVLPSRSSEDDVEGFGTVFLEAGVFGIPSVGTRTGGIPEAVIDGVTGRLVNAEDVEGLREVLHDLLSDPAQTRKLGEGAREMARRFSWDASCQRVMQLYADDDQ